MGVGTDKEEGNITHRKKTQIKTTNTQQSKKKPTKKDQKHHTKVQTMLKYLLQAHAYSHASLLHIGHQKLYEKRSN